MGQVTGNGLVMLLVSTDQSLRDQHPLCICDHLPHDAPDWWAEVSEDKEMADDWSDPCLSHQSSIPQSHYLPGRGGNPGGMAANPQVLGNVLESLLVKKQMEASEPTFGSPSSSLPPLMDLISKGFWYPGSLNNGNRCGIGSNAQGGFHRSGLNHDKGGKLGTNEFRPQARAGKGSCRHRAQA